MPLVAQPTIEAPTIPAQASRPRVPLSQRGTGGVSRYRAPSSSSITN